MARKRRGSAAIKLAKSKLTAGDRGYEIWRTLFNERRCRRLQAITFGGGVTIASTSRFAEGSYPALAVISATIFASCVPLYSNKLIIYLAIFLNEWTIPNSALALFPTFFLIVLFEA
jgi:hypothetical protein